MHLDQHRVSMVGPMRLNLSTNGGALADPEYVHIEPRKKVANLCEGLLVRSSSSIGAN